MRLNKMVTKLNDMNTTTAFPEDSKGMRVDQALAQLFPDYSRSKLQSWLKSGFILINGIKCRPKDKVVGGEVVQLSVTPETTTHDLAEDIKIDIVYEDDDLLLINKSAGLVVHPGAGNPNGTLLNALLHHCPELSKIPRAGIVHRLDKDTTGLMVVTKTLKAHTHVVEQLQSRQMSRVYHAIVVGVMIAGKTIDLPIGRHPTQRTKMAVLTHAQTAKEAISTIRVLDRFERHTLVEVSLQTGRTHQIRVHLSHERYPLVGDPVYGQRMLLPKGASEVLVDTLQNFKRQALHATRLSLTHPTTQEPMSFEAKMPEDMQGLLALLKEHR